MLCLEYCNPINQGFNPMFNLIILLLSPKSVQFQKVLFLVFSFYGTFTLSTFYAHSEELSPVQCDLELKSLYSNAWNTFSESSFEFSKLKEHAIDYCLLLAQQSLVWGTYDPEMSESENEELFHRRLIGETGYIRFIDEDNIKTQCNYKILKKVRSLEWDGKTTWVKLNAEKSPEELYKMLSDRSLEMDEGVEIKCIEALLF